MSTEQSSENVFLLDEHFEFPNLQRTRRIWTYLPAGYHESDQRYPVIYMHDGQNLFDARNAFGNEWMVDETLDADQGRVIVIGIENGEEHRMAEYMMYDHEEHGPAEGAAYLKDLTEHLKPHIDSTLRTLPDRMNTSIAGSSMGGLISLYAGIYFSHIFGNAGIFSPAFWIDAPKIFSEAKEVSERNNLPQRWYFYAGARESETMVSEIAAMVKLLKEVPALDVTYQIDIEGIHDEFLWQRYFPFFYKWLVGDVPAHVIEKVSDITF